MAGRKFIIDENELFNLLECRLRMACLERDGVDNWCGYMNCASDFIRETALEWGIQKDIVDEIYFDDLAECELRNYEVLEEDDLK